MSDQDIVASSHSLFESLTICSKHKLTGRLDITGLNEHWSLYCRLGRLVGDAGGTHPIRRWQRHLSQHCPQLGQDESTVLEACGLRIWDYCNLENLVKQGQIPQAQAVKVIEGSIAEVLFDILQQEAGRELSYNFIPGNNQDGLDCYLLLISTRFRMEYILQQVEPAWEAWCKAGLKERSPNLAPTIICRQKLEQEVSAAAYRRLTNLMDGSRTLRDLAVKLGQEPLQLTQSLLRFLHQDIINLVEISDLSNTVEPGTAITPTPLFPIPKVSTTPKSQLQDALRVAYIDDSPVDSQIMGDILTEAGYQYLSIRDPLQALQTLLDHKPKFIFLDLVMPIANGYEICTQLRRVSIFKRTPVVIVTGNDGLVDRVRAKLAGASGFIAKPINAAVVIAVLHRHGVVTASTSTTVGIQTSTEPELLLGK